MNLLKYETEIKFFDAAHRIANNMIYFPKIAIIAGSGIMESLEELDISQKINYSETGILPDTSVAGHKSELILARHKDKKLLVFTGRFHLYEGYSALETVYPVILAYYLGVNHIILTNSAGGINHKFNAGEIMLIDDIIDFTYKKYHHEFSLQAISQNYQRNKLFSSNWNSLIKDKLLAKHIPYNNGVYAQVTGPNYETRAEIGMLRRIGADAVGMSTGIEAQFARALNMECTACSLITNKSTEVEVKSVSHDEVLSTAKDSSYKVRNYIYSAIETANISEL